MNGTEHAMFQANDVWNNGSMTRAAALAAEV
jgi:hypothetical protein